ncbi:hypothetical protein SNE40_000642 [Patella caerulea]|uniref:GDP-fucose protein O-fucosyltransferase 1 n=1 Tax=Patella caerulea TaxID=87958 RepID=A0AAN8Q2H8_PATCE
MLVLLVLCVGLVSVHGELEVDPNGYIVYCPCMGRFGNQADQFLGSLAFAKSLNRTLVLPPWIEYIKHPSSRVPFNTYFKVAPLRKYLRVILMEQFMKKLAPSIWPKGDRTAFCYSARHGSSDKDSCNAKDGNPFGPFWDHFGIDFDKSELFAPLHYDTESAHEIQRWRDKYTPDKYLVLAFVGPPASFPVKKHHLYLQKYLEWSDNINQKAEKFIEKNIERPFVGIHLRTGEDFKRACEHIDQTPTMFAAAQCIGYRQEFGKTTEEMCYPSPPTVTKDVKEWVKKLKAKTVFVATDSKDFIDTMSKAMKKVKFIRQPSPSSPHVDLAILQKSDHFIGNCISTFTAIVKRFRDIEKKSSSFWAFKNKESKQKEEL